jgi:hypothetical protein
MPRPVFNHEVDVTGVATLSHFLYKRIKRSYLP